METCGHPIGCLQRSPSPLKSYEPKRTAAQGETVGCCPCFRGHNGNPRNCTTWPGSSGEPRMDELRLHGVRR